MFKSLTLSKEDGKLFFLFFSIFFFSYSYEITNFNLTIDDEILAYSTNVALADLGRWVNPLIRFIFWPQQITPSGPLIIFGCAISISFIYILKSFNYDSLKPSFYFFSVYSAFILFPTWIAQLEFSANILQAAIGTLAVSVATLLTVTSIFKSYLNYFSKLLIASFLCAIAVGCYQSLILLFLVLSIGASLSRSVISERFEIRKFSRNLSLIFLIAIIGIAISLAIAKFMMVLYGMQPSPYAQRFLDLQVLLNNPIAVLRTILKDVNQIFNKFYMGFGYAGATFIFAIIYCLYVSIKSIKEGIKARLLISLPLISIVILPASFSLLKGEAMEIRTFFSAAGTICCVLLIAYKLTHSKREQLILTVLACLVAAQGLYINSVVEARGFAVQKHDLFLANAINLEIIQANNGRFSSPLSLHLTGQQKFNSVYPQLPTITTGSSFFQWDGGNPHRMVNYMNLVGIGSYLLATPDQVSRMADNYKDMPVWPQKGSVRVIDGVALVKLSEK